MTYNVALNRNKGMAQAKGKLAALVLALGLAMCPAAAFADTAGADSADIAGTQLVAGSVNSGGAVSAQEAEEQLKDELEQREKSQAQLKELLDEQEAKSQTAPNASSNASNGASSNKTNESEGAEEAEEADETEESESARKQPTDKVLEYDEADIQAIGTQEQTGHTICCPSFSCAYGDAVLDGTVHDHSYYTCSCCTWNDWGGGASVNRCAGTSEELLREAYDQICQGKPTVIHVTGASGEHWICLIGFQDAEDPDHLTLDNFIALDPWDGARITASERWSLYGDGCEHLSTR